jgi:isoleucyl-tRNA synthetase
LVQSALLTSVAWKGIAPYKSVCTHGWVVDGEGKAMHKSLGNGMAPDEVTEKFGADILRIWVASSDYHADIRISPDILKQLAEVYRKIRNTARFILSNLYDFNGTDSIPLEKIAASTNGVGVSIRSPRTARRLREARLHIVYSTIRDFAQPIFPTSIWIS